MRVMCCADSQLSTHWAAILATLDTLLQVVQATHVPRFLVKKLFQQVCLAVAGLCAA